MPNSFGANYGRHPTAAPIYERLDRIEQKLNRLDSAVIAILGRLGLPLEDAVSPEAGATPTSPESAPKIQTSDDPFTYQPLNLGNTEFCLFAWNWAGNEPNTVSGELVHFSLDDKAA